MVLKPVQCPRRPRPPFEVYNRYVPRTRVFGLPAVPVTTLAACIKLANNQATKLLEWEGGPGTTHVCGTSGTEPNCLCPPRTQWDDGTTYYRPNPIPCDGLTRTTIIYLQYPSIYLCRYEHGVGWGPGWGAAWGGQMCIGHPAWPPRRPFG